MQLAYLLGEKQDFVFTQSSCHLKFVHNNIFLGSGYCLKLGYSWLAHLQNTFTTLSKLGATTDTRLLSCHVLWCP